MKVSIKVQRIVGTLFRMRSRMSITFKLFFSGEDYLWFFFLHCHICNIHTYIHEILFPSISWERSSSFSVLRKNIIFSKKKYIIFLDHKRKIILQHNFFLKDHPVGAIEENKMFPCIFLRKIIFYFPSKE